MFLVAGKMLTILAAVFVFGVLVTVHEFGHFITAKLTGMRVDEFAIGFGPKLYQQKDGDTLYSLRAIPLGGYNKIAGMDPDDPPEPGTFKSKPIPSRMLVILAGALMNFLLEPEAMHELIDVICEYRLTYMKLICEHLHPDCIVSHDDWGSKTSLFMNPDTWREFFKEPYRKLYDYLHSQNVIVMHHGDSYMEPIVEDMAEIGVDIWQGVLPTNNIKAISEKVGDRMLLMGGIDSVIDRDDATEEEIRKETRRACEEYGDLKGFWPGMTYGGPGTIYPEVEKIVIDEINKYNIEKFGVGIC